jgi:hypothetical protein
MIVLPSTSCLLLFIRFHMFLLSPHIDRGLFLLLHAFFVLLGCFG